MPDKKLYLHEWVVIIFLLSSIGAVLLVGGIKRNVIKNRIILRKEKESVVEKSSDLICCLPMNRSTAYRK
ncbi:MAG: hypothetical protein FJZ59_00510 [Chlamydiae bacterium]|nr:hypothetical protein [Chlamydiota bacterium]